jgi:hypothetical protein
MTFVTGNDSENKVRSYSRKIMNTLYNDNLKLSEHSSGRCPHHMDPALPLHISVSIRYVCTEKLNSKVIYIRRHFIFFASNSDLQVTMGFPKYKEVEMPLDTLADTKFFFLTLAFF